MVSRRHRSHSFAMPDDLQPIIHLWLLRLLVPLRGHKDFINANDFSNDALAEMLGLGDWVCLNPGNFDANAARAQLRQLYAAGERSLRHVATSPCLYGNVARLAELVGLSDTDCRILEFAVLIHSERVLDDCADWLGQLSSAKVFQALSVLLDLPETQVRAS